MGRLVKVAQMNQLRTDTGLTVEADGRAIALFLVEGKVCALDDSCPHAGGPLGAGYVMDGIVMCPWHGWRFRVTDGVWVDAPNSGTKVPCHRVVQEGDDVYIDVGP